MKHQFTCTTLAEMSDLSFFVEIEKNTIEWALQILSHIFQWLQNILELIRVDTIFFPTFWEESMKKKQWTHLHGFLV